MGALHAGHLSLVEASRRECTFTVVSIFVNSKQFGPHEDFSRYPRDVPHDLELLQSVGADLAFAPADEEIYPQGFSTYVEMTGLAEVMEGQKRPGHFRGVLTVVLKLFELVRPDLAYFGQKDYQQSLVVRRMAADLNLNLAIQVCPIVREADGLALSSRNAYLTPDEREQALALSQSLREARDMADSGCSSVPRLVAAMRARLQRVPAVRIDYLVVADRETLEALAWLDRPAVALVAAHVGTTRLIDNMLIDPPPSKPAVAGDQPD
jgi:pantoate--beta-alanine ligase